MSARRRAVATAFMTLLLAGGCKKSSDPEKRAALARAEADSAADRPEPRVDMLHMRPEDRDPTANRTPAGGEELATRTEPASAPRSRTPADDTALQSNPAESTPVQFGTDSGIGGGGRGPAD